MHVVLCPLNSSLFLAKPKKKMTIFLKMFSTKYGSDLPQMRCRGSNAWIWESSSIVPTKPMRYCTEVLSTPWSRTRVLTWATQGKSGNEYSSDNQGLSKKGLSWSPYDHTDVHNLVLNVICAGKKELYRLVEILLILLEDAPFSVIISQKPLWQRIPVRHFP